MLVPYVHSVDHKHLALNTPHEYLVYTRSFHPIRRWQTTLYILYLRTIPPIFNCLDLIYLFLFLIFPNKVEYSQIIQQTHKASIKLSLPLLNQRVAF